MATSRPEVPSRDASLRAWLDVLNPELTLRAPKEILRRIDEQQVRIVGTPSPPVLREALEMAAKLCSYELSWLFHFATFHHVIVECMDPPPLGCTTKPGELIILYFVPVPSQRVSEVIRWLSQYDPQVDLRAAGLASEGIMILAEPHGRVQKIERTAVDLRRWVESQSPLHPEGE
ncbi:MAG: hypothetical protein AAGA48_01745 [Myxococcota bacterium]